MGVIFALEVIHEEGKLSRTTLNAVRPDSREDLNKLITSWREAYRNYVRV